LKITSSLSSTLFNFSWCTYLDACIRNFSGFILVGCLSGVLFISCQKENDTLSTNQEIIMGDYTGMIIDSTQKVIQSSYNYGEEIFLDFDLNDSADLELVVGEIGSPGMGVHYFSMVQPLNRKTALFGIFTIDTVFLKQVTGYYSDMYNNYKTITDYYCCWEKDPAYRVISCDSAFHALDLDFRDKLKLTDPFSVDTISFIYRWSCPILSNVENDTVVTRSSNYEFDCHSIPHGKEIYIGIKFKDNIERLGWIKLVVGETKMTLKEYAIQRKTE
jgi:hypothetical protein